MQIKIFIPKAESLKVINNGMIPSQFWTSLPEGYSRDQLVELTITKQTFTDWSQHTNTESATQNKKGWLFG